MVDRPLDETELVEQARRGDLAAWETIVRAYQGIAFRTAYLLGGSAADAEEAVQDGFVKAYRALGRFRRGAPLKPWLLRIVANEAKNRRRAAGRREALVVRAAAGDRRGTRSRPPRRLCSRASRAGGCWKPSSVCRTSTATRSRAASSSSSPRMRRRRRSVSAAGR